MIGTGVFTSVGFQLGSVQNTWSILLLWLIGGLLALFGAFAYAELGTYFQESGGDYIYLSRVFHPLAGFLSAWAGLTVGFSAPVALAAMALTKYLAPFGWNGHKGLAIGIIVITGLLHSFSIRHSSRLQNSTTFIKIGFILTLIILGVFMTSHGSNALDFGDSWKAEILSPGFAVSMVYVTFAYTGWNAAAYIVEEMETPSRTLPRALIGSTVFVATVYILFQYALLRHAGVSALEGREEVTYISFNNLLGPAGGKWVSVFIAIQLIATISSYLWVGPRVTWAMAKEHVLWKPLARQNSQGIPVPAIWAHVLIAVVLTLTGSFENILLYAGFVLQLMSSLTVATSLFIKQSRQGQFRSPFKPVLQILFLAFNGWILVFTFIDRPYESLIGLGILAIGAGIFAAERYFHKPTRQIP